MERLGGRGRGEERETVSRQASFQVKMCPYASVFLYVSVLICLSSYVFGLCESVCVRARARTTLDLRRGYVTSCPPRQVNVSNKGSNGPAGSRSGKLHSE